MRKKTHEEYVIELAIKNPTVEVVEEYIGAKTKIKHHCLIHDVYWNQSPTDALKGNGCELCRREKLHRHNCKTTEQYIEELYNVNPNIIVKEKYIDSHTPILHECLLHHIQWKVSPTSALQGHGCSGCKSDKISKMLSKTHEEYIVELKEINPNIVPVEEYIDAITPILHECLIDGYKWMSTPSNVLHGFGCPKCSKRFRRTHDYYVYEVSIVNPDIEVVGEFFGLQTPILHRCKIHNVTWMATPENILNGHGCRMCGNEKVKEKLRKTHEQYVQELKIINPNIEVIGTYIDSFTPILHKNITDNCEWYVSPVNILNGYGYPQCGESIGERCIRLWLESNKIEYIQEKSFVDCKDKKPLPFDFYLPVQNICIEYQGQQHYYPVKIFGGEITFELQQKHDNIKRNYCMNNNIRLLEIPFYKNIEEELNNFLFI